jgi:Toxin co-regulated pilus biosynthesis protein Q
MNGSITTASVNTVLACLLLTMPFMATAQSAIQIASKPYTPQPDIGFVIAPSLTVKPVPAPVAAPAPVKAVPAPSFELKKGKSVEAQLFEFGKQSGWDLVWQAPEFVVDRNMVIQGDFEAAVLSFLNGANEAGTRLRAVFYRGNKTVRVTEF